jgi:PleD family two-component response regulator
MAMDSATRTHDAVTLLSRAWAEPMRRLTSQLVRRRGALSRASGTPASALPLSSGDRGAILLVQVAGARCAALADALAAAGYDVQIPQGLPAAVASLERRLPALVVVDGHAEQDTYWTLRQVGGFPILALISQPTDEQVLAAFAVGVDDCQASGISKDELVARIHNILRSAGRQPAAGVPPHADSGA